MNAHFRRRPLYSACNEDTRSELLALEPGPEDTVIAIAAGGGRALSLLAAGPARLIAVDRRLDQVFNLEFKAAAMAALDREAYAAFLGLWPSSDREDVYAELRSSLTPSARRYWDARRSLIREGVLYAGRTERALFRYSALLRMVTDFDWPLRLFECATLDEQRNLLDREAATLRRCELWWHLFVNPLVFYGAAQDPSFLRTTHGSMGRYLFRRFVGYAERRLMRESFFGHLIYFGCYPEQGPLPPYLERQGFEQARKNLDLLEIHCVPIGDVAFRMRLEGRLKWSLSDVSAWMSEPIFHELVRAICSRGSSGSRLCARNFAADRSLPPDLHGRLSRLDDLCRTLDAEDSAMFYRFEVAEYRGLG